MCGAEKIEFSAKNYNVVPQIINLVPKKFQFSARKFPFSAKNFQFSVQNLQICTEKIQLSAKKKIQNSPEKTQNSAEKNRKITNRVDWISSKRVCDALPICLLLRLKSRSARGASHLPALGECPTVSHTF